MALSIFIHRKLPQVGIVRWFRDPEFNIDYASGQPVHMSREEFRATGHEWIRRHFEEYSTIRVSQEKVVKVFQPGEAKQLMKDRNAEMRSKSAEILREPGSFPPRLSENMT